MRKLLLLFLAILFASGCGVLYRQPIYQGNLLDKAAVDQLQQGMDKRQVMTLLGTPSVRDPFHHDRWDYVASRRTGRRPSVTFAPRASASSGSDSGTAPIRIRPSPSSIRPRTPAALRASSIRRSFSPARPTRGTSGRSPDCARPSS